MVSEHADNAVLAGGPLCPLPSSFIFGHAAEALRRIYDEAGVNASLCQWQESPSIVEQAVDPIGNEAPNIQAPHTSGVSLPGSNDFEIVSKVTNYIISNIALLGRPRWFSALIIVLASLGGIPWTNLRRYSGYYTLRDVASAGQHVFFMALLPQKGGGVGCIPLPLGKAGLLAWRIAKKAYADPRTRKRHIVKDGLESLGKILRAIGLDEAHFLKAIVRVAYYRCQNHFSGFVAAALSGRLVIPCNYILESDIIASLRLGTPLGLDGAPWTSPHKADYHWTTKESHLAEASLRLISDGSFYFRSGSRGPGTELPQSLHSHPSTWALTQWAEFAQLFGPIPNIATLQSWMESVGEYQEGSKTARRAALRVRIKLRDDGKLPLDPPVRFVPWHLITNFLSVLIEELERKYPGKRGQRLIVGGLIAAVIGPRPKETHALHKKDVRIRGSLICSCIGGVKKTHRSRRDAIANLPGEDTIRDWMIDELRHRLTALTGESGARVADYDSASLRQFREAIQGALRRAAIRVLGDDEGISYYTLRHLCAARLLYSALTVAERLNFYNLLGTIAANMGHSLPEFLGGYIGTGIIAVLGRANFFANITTRGCVDS